MLPVCNVDLLNLDSLRLFSPLWQHDWSAFSRRHRRLAPSTSHSSSPMSIPLHCPTTVLLTFLLISPPPLYPVKRCFPRFPLLSLHVQTIWPSSWSSPTPLYPVRRCFPGFPLISLHVQTIWPSSWSSPSTLPCETVFSRVPFDLTTRPNHLTFLLIFPPQLYPVRRCFLGFPLISLHVQTIWPSSWSSPSTLPCETVFSRVPFDLTTRPNHLTLLLIFPPPLYPVRRCFPGFPLISLHVQTIWPSSWSSPLHFTLWDGVFQGSLWSHYTSKPSDPPLDLPPPLYPVRRCFPGFPLISLTTRDLPPSTLPCETVFSRVPFDLTTRPNHLTFLLIFPPQLYPVRRCFLGFPLLSLHVQTIWPSSWSSPSTLPCETVFSRVPFDLTTRANHLTLLLIFPLHFTLWDGVFQGSLWSHYTSKPSDLPFLLNNLQQCTSHFPNWASILCCNYLSINQSINIFYSTSDTFTVIHIHNKFTLKKQHTISN